MPAIYPELKPTRTHVTLVEMLPHVLGPFHPNLREYARKALVKRGVDVRLNAQGKEVHENGISLLHDGEHKFLPAGIVVWASGPMTWSQTRGSHKGPAAGLRWMPTNASGACPMCTLSEISA